MQLKYNFVMLTVDQNVLLSAMLSQGTVLFQFQRLFKQAQLQGCFIKYKILKSSMVLYQSLIFNIYVLNDIYMY